MPLMLRGNKRRSFPNIASRTMKTRKIVTTFSIMDSCPETPESQAILDLGHRVSRK